MTKGVTRSLVSSRGLWGVCGVYVLTHRASGRRYVGQSINIGRRLALHRSDAKAKRSESAIKRAMSEYGVGAFAAQVVDTCAPDMLDELERFAIEFFDSTNREYGFNCKSGGRIGDALVGVARDEKAAVNRALANNLTWRRRHAAGVRARSKDPVWRANVKAGLRALAPRFAWRHPVHGAEVAGASELAEKFAGLNASHLSAVARGELRQHKGWVCTGRAA